MARYSTLAVSNVPGNVVSTSVLTVTLLLLTVSLTTQVQARPASPYQDLHVDGANSQDNQIKGTSIKIAKLREVGATDGRVNEAEFTEPKDEQGLTDWQRPQLSEDKLTSRDSGNSRRSRITRSLGFSEDADYSITTRAARSAWSAESLDITQESTRNPRGARQ